VLHPPQAFFVPRKQVGNTCHHCNARIPAEAVNTTNAFFPAVTGETASGSVGFKLLELWVFHRKRRDMGEGTLFGKPEARERKTTAATQVSVSESLESRFGSYTKLYMFRTDLLSIIRSLNTVFTAIGICHTSYVAVC
jgi:hypothetical protein